MYRFLLRPRWIVFHLVVIGAVVLMVNLGLWQLRRMEERHEFNDRVNARIDQPAAPLDDLIPADAEAGDGMLERIEWRSAEASGEYLPEEQIVVVNRSQGGRAGDMVVTPLLLDDGRVLLVERGFVPLEGEIGSPPPGEISVTGRLRASQAHRRGRITDAAEGELDQVQRLDIGRLAPQLPGPVVPMYLELTHSEPAEPGPFPSPVAAPQLSSGPHLSYAIQWFVFSVCAVAGWVFAVRKSSRSMRARRVAIASVGRK